MPLNPGRYRITARSSGYQHKALAVTVKEAASAPLQFELLPEEDCSIGPEEKIPPDPEQAVGVFNEVSGILIIKDIRIGSGIIKASLQAQADFSFKLITVESLNSGVFNKPAFYDFDTLLAEIPTVFAFKKLWNVQLKATSPAGVYVIKNAEPLD